MNYSLEDMDAMPSKPKKKRRVPSRYTELMNRLLAGETVKVAGVVKGTLQKGLYRAREALEEEAKEFGIAMPVKHIKVEEGEHSGQAILICSLEEPSYNFKPKLQIIE